MDGADGGALEGPAPAPPPGPGDGNMPMDTPDLGAGDPSSTVYLTFLREQAKLKGEQNDATKLGWSLSKLVEETEAQIKKQEELRCNTVSKLKAETATLAAQRKKMKEDKDQSLSQFKEFTESLSAQIKKKEELRDNTISKLRDETASLKVQIKRAEELRRKTLSKFEEGTAALIKGVEELRDKTLSELNAGIAAQIKRAEELRDEKLSKLRQETETQIRDEEERRDNTISKLKKETTAKIRKEKQFKYNRLSRLKKETAAQVTKEKQLRDNTLSKMKKETAAQMKSVEDKMREMDEDAGKLEAGLRWSYREAWKRSTRMIEDFQRKHGVSPRGDFKGPEAKSPEESSGRDSDTCGSSTPSRGKMPRLKPFDFLEKMSEPGTGTTIPDLDHDPANEQTVEEENVQKLKEEGAFQSLEGSSNNPPNQSLPIKKRRGRGRPPKNTAERKDFEDHPQNQSPPRKKRRSRRPKIEYEEIIISDETPGPSSNKRRLKNEKRSDPTATFTTTKKGTEEEETLEGLNGKRETESSANDPIDPEPEVQMQSTAAQPISAMTKNAKKGPLPPNLTPGQTLQCSTEEKDPELNKKKQIDRPCDFCSRPVSEEDVMICGGCKKKAYCSSICKTADWTSPGKGTQEINGQLYEYGRGHKNWCQFSYCEDTEDSEDSNLY